MARDWEAAFFAAETPRTRKVALRSAVVLSPTPGSAFGVLSNLVRLSLGGRRATDASSSPGFTRPTMRAPSSSSSPTRSLTGLSISPRPIPLPNREFMAALRWAWDVPNGFPAPSLAIRLGAIFLRTEPELVLQSCRAVPGRLLDAGFEFEFPEWPEAAEDLVRQWRHKSD